MPICEPDEIISIHLQHCAEKGLDAINNNLVEHGTHKGCGQCCSRVLPTTKLELLTLVNACKHTDVTFPAEPLGTIDMRCPLLNHADNTCMAYDARPAICRAFSCDNPDPNTTAYQNISPLAKDHDMRHELSEFERNICDIACIISNTGVPDIRETIAHLKGLKDIEESDIERIENNQCMAGTLDDGAHAFIVMTEDAMRIVENDHTEALGDFIENLIPKAGNIAQADFHGLRVELFDTRKDPDCP